MEQNKIWCKYIPGIEIYDKMRWNILLLVFSISSCSHYLSTGLEITNSLIEHLLYGKELYYSLEWSSIKSVGDIYSWMVENIRYTRDELEYIQSPQETMVRRAGDCDDFAVLYANMAWVCLNIKMDIIYISTSGLPLPNHAIVYLAEKDIYLEPQNGGAYSSPHVIFIYKFDQVFNK